MMGSYVLTPDDIELWKDLHFGAVRYASVLEVAFGSSNQYPEQHEGSEDEQREIQNTIPNGIPKQAAVNTAADDNENTQIEVPVAYRLENSSTGLSYFLHLSGLYLRFYKYGKLSVCKRILDELKAVKRLTVLSEYGVDANGCYEIEVDLTGCYEEGSNANKKFTWGLSTSGPQSTGDNNLTYMYDYALTPQDMKRWKDLHFHLRRMPVGKPARIHLKFAGKVDVASEPSNGQREEPLDVALSNYFNWLKSRVRTPNWKDDLEEAWEMVNEERLYIRQLKRCFHFDLTKFGMKRGIAQLVLDEIPAWEKYRTVVKWQDDGGNQLNGRAYSDDYYH